MPRRATASIRCHAWTPTSPAPHLPAGRPPSVTRTERRVRDKTRATVAAIKIATNPRTSESRATSSSRGISTGLRPAKSPRDAWARSSPAAPPATVTTPASSSICRTMRRRPAPSASRSACSFAREASRTRRSPATFEQTRRSTSPTAPQSAKSAGRVRPRACSTSERMWMLRWPLVLGVYSSCNCRTIPVSCDSASWRETPAFRRPTTTRTPRDLERSSLHSGRSATAARTGPTVVQTSVPLG